jgi:hypothetical protein
VSVSVVCTGCGKNLPVGEDYLRKKMRCPECGVIFDLPPPEKKRSFSSQSAGWIEDRGSKIEDRAREHEPEPLSSILDPRVLVDAPTAVKEAPPSAPKPTVPPPKPPTSAADEPGTPSAEAKAAEDLPSEEERCPVCNELLPLEASHCPLCGFLLPIGKKVFKVNQPLERHWEAGLSLRKRLTLFIACQVMVLTAIMVGSLAVENPLIFLFPWLIFTGMTAFLFGSNDRIDLTRNKRGKVRLTQTWRIAFLSRAPINHRLGDYEQLATGVANDFSNMDYIITMALFLSGILPGVRGFIFGGFSIRWLLALIIGMIPAVIWWFCAFHKDNYFVALCRDHGFPAVMLYRGWNEAHSQDMAKTIGEVTGLPRRKI